MIVIAFFKITINNYFAVWVCYHLQTASNAISQGELAASSPGFECMD